MIVDNQNVRRRVKSRELEGLASLGQSNVNATTIWTPQAGWFGVVGDSSSAQTPIINIPAPLGAPACSSGPANTADSPECIALLLANQQHDMGVSNAANYQIDLANCLNTFPQPKDCYQRTFGLTPVGGYTGSLVGDLQKGINVQQFITGFASQSPSGGGGSVAPPKTSQQEQTKQQQQASTKIGNSNITIGGQNISSIVDKISEPVSVAGFDIPLWGIGIAIVGGLFVASRMGGGH